jgi:hypothetical protein
VLLQKYVCINGNFSVEFEHQFQVAQQLHIEFTERTYRALRTVIFSLLCSYANFRKCALSVRGAVKKALLINLKISSRGDVTFKSHCLVLEDHNMAMCVLQVILLPINV